MEDPRTALHTTRWAAPLGWREARASLPSGCLPRGTTLFLAVGLAYLVDQAAKIILEGIYTPAYASGVIDGYITALQVASWLGFMLCKD